MRRHRATRRPDRLTLQQTDAISPALELAADFKPVMRLVWDFQPTALTPRPPVWFLPTLCRGGGGWARVPRTAWRAAPSRDPGSSRASPRSGTLASLRDVLRWIPDRRGARARVRDRASPYLP